jgi:hypothetical protein
LPALKTTSRFAVGLTLLPLTFFIVFWIFSWLTHDPNDHWSTELDAAIFISIFSDVAVVTLIRKSISIIGKQAGIPVILFMLGLQGLCIVFFTLLPAILGYLADPPAPHVRSAVTFTLYLTALLNLTTVLLSIGFMVSLTLVIAHRFFWPVLERALYPIAEFRVIKNRKLMGGLAALCLGYTFNLSGLLKEFMEAMVK